MALPYGVCHMESPYDEPEAVLVDGFSQVPSLRRAAYGQELTSLDSTLTMVPEGGRQVSACRTVSSREAAVERPGTDSQRVLQADTCRPTSAEPVNSQSLISSQIVRSKGAETTH